TIVTGKRDRDELPRQRFTDRRIVARSEHKGHHVRALLPALGAGKTAPPDPGGGPLVRPYARAGERRRTVKINRLGTHADLVRPAVIAADLTIEPVQPDDVAAAGFGSQQGAFGR